MSGHTVWLLVLMLGTTLARSNLPNQTELTVQVMVDSGWVKSNGGSLANVDMVLTQVITSASSSHVSMKIDVMELVSEESKISLETNFDVNETDVLVTLTRCSTTHNIHDSILAGGVDHILHVGVTSVPCARLDNTGVLMPMVTTNNDMVQLISDFKHADTFYGWTSFTVIFDEGVSPAMEDDIYQVLAQDASIATFRLPSQAGQQDINSMLRDIPASRLGGKFLIMTKHSNVESFIKAVAI